MAARISGATLEREIRRAHFAVLATRAADGGTDSAGVSYGAAREGEALVLYVMTRRQLRKARDIAAEPRVSLVIPVARRLLWSMPPATIQVRGRAEILAEDDARGVAVFRGFVLGRRILAGYRALRERGERLTCFLRITLDPVAHSYLVGASLWEAMRRMESASATVRLSGDERAATSP